MSSNGEPAPDYILDALEECPLPIEDVEHLDVITDRVEDDEFDN